MASRDLPTKTPPLRRAVATLLACLLVLAPAAGHAKPKGEDARVLGVVKQAEDLLNRLEYERARELLEASARDAGLRKASPTAKAQLWAQLGRARAELGDSMGSEDAFLVAVRWDRRVKLARSTSPKIVEALDRARAMAPAPGDEPPPPEPEPPPSRPQVAEVEPEPEPPPVVETPPARPEPAARPERAEPPQRPERAERPERPQRAERPVAKREPPPKAEARPAPPAAAKLGPWMRQRLDGEVLLGRSVELVIEHQGLPRDARFDAWIRRTQTGAFRRVQLARTGTVAKGSLELDRPRIELYVTATQGRKVVARVGSETEPVVVSTEPPPPPIVQAWSGDLPKVAPSAEVRTSTTVAAAPVAATRVESTSALTDLEIGLIAAGGAVVVTGLVILAVVLFGKPKACDAREGFGCTEVTILPLASF